MTYHRVSLVEEERLTQEFEYTKVVIIIRKPKVRQGSGQKKKGQTTIYKTLCRQLKREQHKPHLNPRMNSGALKV
jgi:hypothetical protein